MQPQPDHRRFITDQGGGPGDEGLYGEASAEGTHEGAGWFRFYFDDDRWEWSPEVERMHGYQSGTVTPTTRLVLSHKHPDDCRQVADTIEEIRRTRQAFTGRHRICDTKGQVHHVIVVADQLRDDDGVVIGTHGFYIDVTPSLAARRQQVTEAVAQIADHRGPIEQAKGMLMVVYNIGADEAFNLLRWLSQKANIKLRLLAEQIVSDFASFRHDGPMAPRSMYDNLLMSADRRIVPGAKRHRDGGGAA